jgi:hypothetical protein
MTAKKEKQDDSVIAKLARIQSKLVAGKGQTNAFGKYRYRSCEDILEALKPHLSREGCALIIRDSIEEVAGRVYVKANVQLACGDGFLESEAFAREPLTKKGMDESQITGAASSYARKYALNALFCIDDTKDADTMDNRMTRDEADDDAAETPMTQEQTYISAKASLMKLCDGKGWNPSVLNVAIENEFKSKLADLDISGINNAVDWARTVYTLKSGDKVGGDIPGEVV